MEDNLVHGPGPLLGLPYRLMPFQRDFLGRLYEYNPDTGKRIVRRALLGLGKKNAKTELLAAIGLAELCGPFAPRTPDVVIAAATREQAGILFRCATIMATEGPLKPFLECFTDRIEVIGGYGQLYRVAAVDGPNDGRLPTCVIADELHEWTGTTKENVHNVLANSLIQADEPLELNISTAGFDLNTLLGKMYQHGLAVRSGEIDDPAFLFRWHEADPTLDLADHDQLVEAIKQANPGAEWIPGKVEKTIDRFNDPVVPEFRFRRYYLNQWTSSDEAWLPAGAWDALKVHRVVEPGTPVVLGFDGSRNNDATALIGVTVEDVPHVFVVGCWEKPTTAPEGWEVDILLVEQAIREACTKYKVREVACDPFRWARSMQVLQRERLPMVEFPQTAGRMTPATTRAMETVGNHLLTQDGDPRLARHVGNAVLKNDDRGVRLNKVSPKSDRKIDLAVAMVMALERAAYFASKRRAPFKSMADYLTPPTEPDALEGE